jgi:putative two-component system response regulator
VDHNRRFLPPVACAAASHSGGSASAPLQSPELAQVGGTVLVVDDVSDNRDLLSRLLRGEGHTVITASNGDEALELVSREHPDVVLLDVLMPKMSGYEACERLKSDPATRLIPVVLVTALNERRERIRGINAGADDFLTKPVDPNELRARVRSLVRLKRYTDELDSAESVILSLALTVEARDRYTVGHCQRLAAYATSLGRCLNLPEDELTALYKGGFLHDIGKIGVTDAVLLKPARLTEAELVEIRQHPVIGDRLCGELRSLRPVRSIIRHHHERLDGTGYPDGLKGDAAPFLAQLVSIVDTFDALTTERPYKPACSTARACEELRAECGKGWRRTDLVEAFLTLVERGELSLPEGAQAALVSHTTGSEGM